MNLTVAQLARHLEGEADDNIVVLAPGGVLIIPADTDTGAAEQRPGRCRVTATFTVHGGDYTELVREAEKRARSLFGDDNWEFTRIDITAARLASIGTPMLWAADIEVTAA